jgi:hypothetical protein
MAHKKRVADVLDRQPVPIRKKPEESEAVEEQSGDLQGLSDVADADSESVRELVGEGQFFEAEIVNGVENAPPADAGPVKVHRRKEDDLPPEYRDTRKQDEPKE